MVTLSYELCGWASGSSSSDEAVEGSFGLPYLMRCTKYTTNTTSSLNAEMKCSVGIATMTAVVGSKATSEGTSEAWQVDEQCGAHLHRDTYKQRRHQSPCLGIDRIEGRMPCEWEGEREEVCWQAGGQAGGQRQRDWQVDTYMESVLCSQELMNT